VAKKRILRGAIIWAEVREPIHRQPVGEHPAVVLNSQEEIDRGDPLRVVVCSTGFSYPLRPGWFDMPSRPGPGGHPATGLDEACVVKATWIDNVPQSAARMKRPTDRCPAAIFRQINDWLLSHGVGDTQP